ncbi:glycosyltransferase family 2 protein [Arcanobacterium bovis]|uniref:Glycosyltransferase n=1 Tax=Arcanobacterium bovis TaxID=2529275 RepID=A0A4Q9V3F4_9ACTO|nr:glycosyltransferase family 2 protein [Arcanobacterium bovis]TBW23652.1 glycosyltransferase [Arcanobacterium bovis]
MSPRASIIMRTQNRPLLLKRALASVCAQSFADFELIVVNDAGEPAPVEACVAAVPESLRSKIQIIHREQATGMEAASNAALAQATGDYVAIHDDDDTWHPDFLRTCVDFLDAHSDHVAVAVRCDVIREKIDDDGTITELEREVLDADRSYWTLIDTLVASYSPPIAQLVRRDIAVQMDGWNESMKTQGDWEFSVRLLAQGPAGFIDGESLAYWHHRKDTQGAMGNSIFLASDDHVRANLLARDRYLREQINRADNGHSTSLFGEVLQVAEYYKRLSNQLQQQIDSLHAAIYASHLDTKNDVEALNAKMDAATEKIANLESNVSSLVQALQAERKLGD